MPLSPWVDSAFFKPTSARTDDVLTDQVFRCLMVMGIADLSVAAVARGMNVTPAATLKRAGGQERFVLLVVATFADRCVRWVCRIRLYDDVPVVLPADDGERHAVTMWQALQELARGAALAGRPGPLAAVADARAQERAHLRTALARYAGHQPSEAELDAAAALVTGIREAMADPTDPLPVERAEAAVRAGLAGLLGARSERPVSDG